MDREKTIELGNQVYKVVITELFYYIKRNNYE